MSNRANPTVVKTAITNGATFSGGKLVVSGTAYWLRLDTTDPDNPAWVLDASEGVKFWNRTQFTMVKNNIVLADPGEYQWCIATSGGMPIGQLAVTNIEGENVAAILDP